MVDREILQWLVYATVGLLALCAHTVLVLTR